jgi:hypothetical protein
MKWKGWGTFVVDDQVEVEVKAEADVVVGVVVEHRTRVGPTDNSREATLNADPRELIQDCFIKEIGAGISHFQEREQGRQRPLATFSSGYC